MLSAGPDPFDPFSREEKRHETDLRGDTYSAVVRYKRLRENSVLTILSGNANTMHYEAKQSFRPHHPSPDRETQRK